MANIKDLLGAETPHVPADALVRLLSRRDGASDQQMAVASALAIDAQPAGTTGRLAARHYSGQLLRLWASESHFPLHVAEATQSLVSIVCEDRFPGPETTWSGFLRGSQTVRSLGLQSNAKAIKLSDRLATLLDGSVGESHHSSFSLPTSVRLMFEVAAVSADLDIDTSDLGRDEGVANLQEVARVVLASAVQATLSTNLTADMSGSLIGSGAGTATLSSPFVGTRSSQQPSSTVAAWAAWTALSDGLMDACEAEIASLATLLSRSREKAITSRVGRLLDRSLTLTILPSLVLQLTALSPALAPGMFAHLSARVAALVARLAPLVSAVPAVTADEARVSSAQAGLDAHVDGPATSADDVATARSQGCTAAAAALGVALRRPDLVGRAAEQLRGVSAPGLDLPRPRPSTQAWTANEDGRGAGAQGRGGAARLCAYRDSVLESFSRLCAGAAHLSAGLASGAAAPVTPTETTLDTWLGLPVLQGDLSAAWLDTLAPLPAGAAPLSSVGTAADAFVASLLKLTVAPGAASPADGSPAPLLPACGPVPQTGTPSFTSVPTARGLLLRAWLQSKTPLKGPAARKRQFPAQEVAALAAYLKHAPSGVGSGKPLWEEAQSVLNAMGAASGVDPAVFASPSLPAAVSESCALHFSSAPASAELLKAWGRCVELRRWLQERCDEYKQVEDPGAAARIIAAATAASASAPPSGSGGSGEDVGNPGTNSTSQRRGSITIRVRSSSVTGGGIAEAAAAAVAAEAAAAVPAPAPVVSDKAATRVTVAVNPRLAGLLNPFGAASSSSGSGAGATSSSSSPAAAAPAPAPSVVTDEVGAAATGEAAPEAPTQRPVAPGFPLTDVQLLDGVLSRLVYVVASGSSSGSQTQPAATLSSLAELSRVAKATYDAAPAHAALTGLLPPRWMHDGQGLEGGKGGAGAMDGSAAVCTTVNWIAREGWFLDPTALESIRLVRAVRARTKALGMHALAQVLRCTLPAFPSIARDVLAVVRVACASPPSSASAPFISTGFEGLQFSWRVHTLLSAGATGPSNKRISFSDVLLRGSSQSRGKIASVHSIMSTSAAQLCARLAGAAAADGDAADAVVHTNPLVCLAGAGSSSRGALRAEVASLFGIVTAAAAVVLRSVEAEPIEGGDGEDAQRRTAAASSGNGVRWAESSGSPSDRDPSPNKRRRLASPPRASRMSGDEDEDFFPGDTAAHARKPVAHQLAFLAGAAPIPPAMSDACYACLATPLLASLAIDWAVSPASVTMASDAGSDACDATPIIAAGVTASGLDAALAHATSFETRARNQAAFLRSCAESALLGTSPCGRAWAPLSPLEVVPALLSGAISPHTLLVHMAAGCVAAAHPGLLDTLLRPLVVTADDLAAAADGFASPASRGGAAGSPIGAVLVSGMGSMTQASLGGASASQQRAAPGGGIMTIRVRAPAAARASPGAQSAGSASAPQLAELPATRLIAAVDEAASQLSVSALAGLYREFVRSPSVNYLLCRRSRLAPMAHVANQGDAADDKAKYLKTGLGDGAPATRGNPSVDRTEQYGGFTAAEEEAIEWAASLGYYLQSDADRYLRKAAEAQSQDVSSQPPSVFTHTARALSDSATASVIDSLAGLPCTLLRGRILAHVSSAAEEAHRLLAVLTSATGVAAAPLAGAVVERACEAMALVTRPGVSRGLPATQVQRSVEHDLRLLLSLPSSVTTSSPALLTAALRHCISWGSTLHQRQQCMRLLAALLPAATSASVLAAVSAAVAESGWAPGAGQGSAPLTPHECVARLLLDLVAATSTPPPSGPNGSSLPLDPYAPSGAAAFAPAAGIHPVYALQAALFASVPHCPRAADALRPFAGQMVALIRTLQQNAGAAWAASVASAVRDHIRSGAAVAASWHHEDRKVTLSSVSLSRKLAVLTRCAVALWVLGGGWEQLRPGVTVTCSPAAATVASISAAGPNEALAPLSGLVIAVDQSTSLAMILPADGTGGDARPSLPVFVTVDACRTDGGGDAVHASPGQIRPTDGLLADFARLLSLPALTAQSVMRPAVRLTLGQRHRSHSDGGDGDDAPQPIAVVTPDQAALVQLRARAVMALSALIAAPAVAPAAAGGMDVENAGASPDGSAGLSFAAAVVRSGLLAHLTLAAVEPLPLPGWPSLSVLQSRLDAAASLLIDFEAPVSYKRARRSPLPLGDGGFEDDEPCGPLPPLLAFVTGLASTRAPVRMPLTTVEQANHARARALLKMRGSMRSSRGGAELLDLSMDVDEEGGAAAAGASGAAGAGAGASSASASASGAPGNRVVDMSIPPLGAMLPRWEKAAEVVAVLGGNISRKRAYDALTRCADNADLAISMLLDAPPSEADTGGRGPVGQGAAPQPRPDPRAQPPSAAAAVGANNVVHTARNPQLNGASPSPPPPLPLSAVRPSPPPSAAAAATLGSRTPAVDNPSAGRSSPFPRSGGPSASPTASSSDLPTAASAIAADEGSPNRRGEARGEAMDEDADGDADASGGAGTAASSRRQRRGAMLPGSIDSTAVDDDDDDEDEEVLAGVEDELWFEAQGAAAGDGSGGTEGRAATTSGNRFDECIVEGIAFNEPLIVDIPPRLPRGYVPIHKQAVFAAAQAVRTSGGSASAAAPVAAVAPNARAADGGGRESRSGVGWRPNHRPDYGSERALLPGGAGIAVEDEDADANPGADSMITSTGAVGAGVGVNGAYSGPPGTSAPQFDDIYASLAVTERPALASSLRRPGTEPFSNPTVHLETISPAVSVARLAPGTLVWVDVPLSHRSTGSGQGAAGVVDWVSGDGNKVVGMAAHAPRGMLATFVRVAPAPVTYPSPGSAAPPQSDGLAYKGAVAVVRVCPLGPAASDACAWDVTVPVSWVRLPFSLFGACFAQEPLSRARIDGSGAPEAAGPYPATAASLHALTAVYASAIATRAALAGVASLILSWPAGMPFSVDAVGGPRPLLSLARLIAAHEGIASSAPPGLLTGTSGGAGGGAPSGAEGAAGASADSASSAAAGSAGPGSSGVVHVLSARSGIAIPGGIGLELLASSTGVAGMPGASAAAAGALAAAGSAGSAAGGEPSSGSRLGGVVTEAAMRLITDALAQEQDSTRHSQAQAWAHQQSGPPASSWQCPSCTFVNSLPQDAARGGSGGDGSVVTPVHACSVCGHTLRAGAPLPPPLIPYPLAPASVRAACIRPRKQHALASLLVADVVSSLSQSADAAAACGGRTVTKSSPHPIADMTAAVEVGTLAVSDGSMASLWVSFDSRCETDQADEGCFLAFYALPPDAADGSGVGGAAAAAGTYPSTGSAGSGSAALTSTVQTFKTAGAALGALRGVPVARFSGPSHMFQPFIVQTRSLQYAIFKGRARRGASAGGASGGAKDGGWGVQLSVTPLNGVSWGHASEVPLGPAMLWGSSLLDVLLCGGLSHAALSAGLVHNARVVATLIDYLRTSGAPFKERLLATLLRLLGTPEYLLLTPRHVDFAARSTAEAVTALAANGAPSPHTTGEFRLLSQVLAVPLKQVEIMRVLTAERVAAAQGQRLLFLPKSLQLLQEVVAAADIAIRRGRAQLHLLAASRGDIYGPRHYGPGGDGASFSPLSEPVSASMAQEGRVLLAQSARADAAVPVFDPVRAQATSAHRWVPTLIINVAHPESTLRESAAMVYLREILTCILTGRRIPDAWMCRAIMRAHGSTDITCVTSERLTTGHVTCAKFTPAADYAVGAWMATLASKAQSDALSLDPASLELRENDVASFPVLGRYSQAELRLRASVLRVVNALLQKCINSIDMSPDSATGIDLLAHEVGAGQGGASGSVGQGAGSASAAPSALVASSSAVSAAGGGVAPTAHLASLSLGAMLRRVPHLVLVDAKERIVNDAIEQSTTPGLSGVRMSLDNRAVTACQDARIVAAPFTLCTFAQIFRHIVESRVSDRALRCKLSDREFLWEVRFVGLAGSSEEGLDWGGLYREVLERMMTDLFGEPDSQQGIDLFALSPNANATRVEDEGGGGGGAAAAANVAAAASSSAAADALALAATGGVDGSFIPSPLYCLAAVEGPQLQAALAAGSGAPAGAPAANASGLPAAATPRVAPPGADVGAPTAAAGAPAGGAPLPPLVRASASLPSSSVSLAGAMFAFCGKLMGISVRTKACLDFDLALPMWRLLTDEPVGVPELTSLDGRLGGLMQRVLDWQPPQRGGGDDEGGGASSSSSNSSDAAATEAAFAEAFAGLVFAMPETPLIVGNDSGRSAAGIAAPGSLLAATRGGAPVMQLAWMPLLPGGTSLPVTYTSRQRYVSLVCARAFAPMAWAARHMRSGLAAIIPDRALRLCGWRDLQRLVCGENDVDLDVLKRNSEYDARGFYSPDHAVIKHFWEVMETFTPDQRRNFIR